jgi:HD-GYP domain-containing protein (c-di-GMP phosphodiesterase class II)
MTSIGIDSQTDLSPAVQELLEDFADAAPQSLGAREKAVAIGSSAIFLAAALGLLLLMPAGRTFDPALAGVLVVAFALVKQVKFEVGIGYGIPTELVFVPILLLAPAPAVPLLVFAGMLLGNVPDLMRGTHADRLLFTAGDSWYAFGPALIVGFAGVGTIGWGDAPVLVVALAAQFACDLLAATLQDWLALGVKPELGLGLMTWVTMVDVLLAPIGLAGALASQQAPFAFLLVLPLAGLLWVFARERSTRIQHAIELGRAYRGTTLLLSDVLEADDEYTGSHSHGVVALAIEVAGEMGLGPTELRNIEFGALLHDVGKIAIPKEIINKPGPLDDDEWLVIKTHTLEGQRMLDRVGGVMGDIGRIVRSSHERWDGGGYPDGLAGEAIPLEARICAVCDAFSAMTTDRSYRKAMSVAEALIELRLNAGSQFDPGVVTELIRIVDGQSATAAKKSRAALPVHGVTSPAQ